MLAESGVYPYATFDTEDSKEPTALITSALMKEDGTLGVFTASNITYDVICDRVHLPKGQYRSVEENARLKIFETDTETIVEF